MVPEDEPLAQAGFEEISREYGVTVFERTGAEIIDIAAEGCFDAPPAGVRQVLLDYDRHAGRIARVSESRVVGRGLGWLVVYQRLALPVIDDRDFFLEVRFGEEDGRSWIHFEAVHPEREPRPDAIRISLHSGSWQLRPEGSGTFARYQSRIDLAGLLPRWMARSRVGDEVPGLFVALRKLVTD